MEVEKLKNIAITDVAVRLGIQLVRNKTLCFMHDEKSASLHFNKNSNSFYCFGCGGKGDVIELVKIILKTDFIHACEWLSAEFLGTVSSKKFISNPKSVRTAIHKPSLDNRHVANIEIYTWIVNNTTLSKVATDYLMSERKFTKKTIEKFQIRDLMDPKIFLNKLLGSWSIEQLTRCGLILTDDKNQPRLLWWDHVIIFPFVNVESQVEYIQARRMKKDKNSKYLNLIGVKKPMYNSVCLFDMKVGEKLVICEGIPDAITMEEYGQKAVGILGANSFQQSYVRDLIDYNLYVLPDTDDSGVMFGKKVQEFFKSAGKNVNTILLPKNVKDLNEFYTANIRNK